MWTNADTRAEEASRGIIHKPRRDFDSVSCELGCVERDVQRFERMVKGGETLCKRHHYTMHEARVALGQTINHRRALLAELEALSAPAQAAE